MWGFAGSRYARFSSFLFKPEEIVDYAITLARGKPAHYAGHNPAGSLAVFALLALGVASGVTGVILFQDIGGNAMEELHEVVSYAMLVVVALHVAGVLASSVLHRENLVGAMITGRKSAQPNQGIRRTHVWMGVIILAMTVAFWVGYPSTGLMQADSSVSQSEQHGDD